MSWLDTATKARALMPEQSSYGQKQKSMAEAAAHLGLTRQSLRNILSAYDFLLGIKSVDAAAYDALSETPYSSVQIYSRWATYDLDAALAHAKWSKSRGASVKSVIADESAARSRAIGAAGASNLENLVDSSSALSRLRPDVSALFLDAGATGLDGEWILNDIADPFSLAMMVRKMVGPTTLGVAVKARRRAEAGPLLQGIGILELGERTLAENYRKDAKDFLARAVAATTLYVLVLVIAPDEEALTTLVSGLPNPRQWKSSQGQAPIVTLRPCLGGVMFTSWANIDSDLSA